MPCANCEHWIPSECKVYQVEENVDGDGRTVYILRTLAGTEKCSVETLDVETISKTLAVREYRIKIMQNGKALHIIEEKLHWRYCEADPPPSYIKKYSHDWFPGMYWFFICEKCRDVDPNLEYYTNINFEGNPSTGSEEEDDRDSVNSFRN